MHLPIYYRYIYMYECKHIHTYTNIIYACLCAAHTHSYYRLNLGNVRNKYCFFFLLHFSVFLFVEFVATFCKTLNYSCVVPISFYTYYFLRGFRLQLIFASAVCIHTYIDISLYSSVYMYMCIPTTFWLIE